MPYHADVSESDLNSSVIYTYLSEPDPARWVPSWASSGISPLIWTHLLPPDSHLISLWSKSWCQARAELSSNFVFSPHKSKTTEMLFLTKVIHGQTNIARTLNWVLKQEIISSKFYYSVFCHTPKKLTKTQFQWVNDAAAETDVPLNVKTGARVSGQYVENFIKHLCYRSSCASHASLKREDT